MKMEIIHERIQPGRPQQNGRHERMHRTLKEETTRPAALTLQLQQKKFDRFRQVFNYERPHEGEFDAEALRFRPVQVLR
jgi:transposase InsO family protein